MWPWWTRRRGGTREGGGGAVGRQQGQQARHAAHLPLTHPPPVLPPAPPPRMRRFLKKAFGVAPRVGWQIDPFGHSSTQAGAAGVVWGAAWARRCRPGPPPDSAPCPLRRCRPQAGLLSAQVGFDALFFGRADYQVGCWLAGSAAGCRRCRAAPKPSSAMQRCRPPPPSLAPRQAPLPGPPLPPLPTGHGVPARHPGAGGGVAGVGLAAGRRRLHRQLCQRWARAVLRAGGWGKRQQSCAGGWGSTARRAVE